MKSSLLSVTDVHKGQALPLCLAVIVLAVMSVLMVANTVQTAADKTRVINAADAAAYSGLIWQARALNFQAYANRAMVANQVAIGQAVSLQAWSLYTQVTADNLHFVSPASAPNEFTAEETDSVPVVLESASVAGTAQGLQPQALFQQAPNAALSQMQQIVEPLVDNLLLTASAMNTALSRLQQEIHLSALAETQSIVRQVVVANDPDMQVSALIAPAAFAENALQWNALTVSHHSRDGEAMRIRADVIQRSQDEYSRERQHDYPVNESVAIPSDSQALYRRGATRLLQVPGDDGSEHWQWLAKDTLSLNSANGNEVEQGEGSSAEIPIGWGQALTTESSASALATNNCENTSDACEPWFNLTRQAEQWSNTGRHSLAGRSSREIVSPAMGLNSFRDLRANTPEPAALQLHVEVNLPRTESPVSENLGIDGMFALKGDYGADSLAALASAEVYFEHPDDPSQAPNLYQPYWDVRLISTPEALRQHSWALRQGPGLPPSDSPLRRDYSHDGLAPRFILPSYSGLRALHHD